MPTGPQIGSLERGAHIVVGTPGRIEDHLRKNTLQLDNVQTFVLDEADRMLEMGFEPSLNAIIARLPRKRQTLLFSATYPEQINSMASRVMVKPVTVKVESTHGSATIRQHFHSFQENKLDLWIFFVNTFSTDKNPKALFVAKKDAKTKQQARSIIRA